MKKIILICENIFSNFIDKKYNRAVALKNKYHDKKDWYWCILKKEKNYPISIFKRLKMYRLGFTSDEYIKYDLKNNNYKNYITDVERWKSRRINGDYNIIFDDKILFFEIFKNYLNIPETLGTINSGIVYDKYGNIISTQELINMIKKSNGLVFRNNKSGGGIGLYIVKFVNNYFLINNQKTSLKNIKIFLNSRNNYIITPVIENMPYSNEIFSKSVNTIRIIIAKDKELNDFIVVGCWHRFGSNASAPVDNICSGGFIAPIDLKTNRLGKLTANNINGFFEKHPDTNAQVEGVEIPNLEKVKQDLLLLSRKFPYINFIAWDVVISSNGFYVIEGNTSTDINMLQWFGGLRNSELGKIYRQYNIKR